MIKHTITVPDPMSAYIASQIESGMYGNISEYYRDLVRRDQERRGFPLEALRHAIDIGDASGDSDMTTADARLRARKELGLCD